MTTSRRGRSAHSEPKVMGRDRTGTIGRATRHSALKGGGQRTIHQMTILPVESAAPWASKVKPAAEGLCGRPGAFLIISPMAIAQRCSQWRSRARPNGREWLKRLFDDGPSHKGPGHKGLEVTGNPLSNCTLDPSSRSLIQGQCPGGSLETKAWRYSRYALKAASSSRCSAAHTISTSS